MLYLSISLSYLKCSVFLFLFISRRLFFISIYSPFSPYFVPHSISPLPWLFLNFSSSFYTDEKFKIAYTIVKKPTPKVLSLFVIRTLKNLCTDCGNIWDGFLGSSHPLGYGARPLCRCCFLLPGITSVISRAQAKAMYAMKETELPSVVSREVWWKWRTICVL